MGLLGNIGLSEGEKGVRIVSGKRNKLFMSILFWRGGSSIIEYLLTS